MDKKKKKWEIPKLICLYRGRPEEAVLRTCSGQTSPGPNIQSGSCSSTAGIKCKDPWGS